MRRRRCRETGEDLTDPPEWPETVQRGDPEAQRLRLQRALENERKAEERRKNPPPPEPDDGIPF